MKDSKLKNAIIVNGVIYVAKRTAYPMIKDMCNLTYSRRPKLGDSWMLTHQPAVATLV